MAVYSTITAKAQPGKFAQAVEWGTEIVAWANENYMDEDMQLLTNIGGHAGTLHFVAKYESMAQWEQVTAKMNEDEGYQSRLRKMNESELFSDISSSHYRVIA